MNYYSIAETAKRWGMAERTVRNYCAQGKVPEAFMIGKTWSIPEGVPCPKKYDRNRSVKGSLLELLRKEKRGQIPEGVYARLQVNFAYHSNRIDGGSLTVEQIRHIYENGYIRTAGQMISVDDIVKACNHFQGLDIMIEDATHLPSERMLKGLHALLAGGVGSSRKKGTPLFEYQGVGDVSKEVKMLITEYNASKEKTLDEILDFHVRLERLQPFAGSNGQVGRLLMFKECLRNGITPFVIEEDTKIFYYRGLTKWEQEKSYLRDACMLGQERFVQSILRQGADSAER